jgi:hypothetical protein
MTDTKTRIWHERAEPLFKKFRELNGRCFWETYASLNTDRPHQKDIVIQHWYVAYPATEGRRGSGRYFMVYIWTDGSGWNVFGELDRSGDIDAALAAIEKPPQ